jgi:hypothetical protein
LADCGEEKGKRAKKIIFFSSLRPRRFRGSLAIARLCVCAPLSVAAYPVPTSMQTAGLRKKKKTLVRLNEKKKDDAEKKAKYARSHARRHDCCAILPPTKRTVSLVFNHDKNQLNFVLQCSQQSASSRGTARRHCAARVAAC